MKVVILDNAESVAKYGANLFIEFVRGKPRAVLGLATGSTPIVLYSCLARSYQGGTVSFAETTSFNLDEYLGLAPQDSRSYRFFMQKHLFSHIDIPFENTFVPESENKDPQMVCEQYEALIQEKGGIDIQLLGIGANGHIGFNEPDSSFYSRTRVNKLSWQTMKDNARFFEEDEEQPEYAITMGIGTILDAKQILLLATGKGKAMAVHAAIEGPISKACPASALQVHPNTTFVLDRSAASELDKTRFYHGSSQVSDESQSEFSQ